MPEVTTPVSNTFCWVDLNTTDTAAAKKFYGEIFGWKSSDMPMPAGSYTIASLGEKLVAGIMTLPENAKKMGAPPHWLSYVAVDDVDATTKKVRELGGKVLMEPTQMGPGRFAVLEDPTGGAFAIWKSEKPMGTWLYGETGALCWNELMTGNVDKAGKFYVNLFGWKADSMKMGNEQYTVFKLGERQVGGMMAIGPQMKGAPTAWSAYFAVKSADGTAKKVQERGGKVLVPGTDIPNIGRFAVFADPQGAVFAVLQPAS